MVTSQQPGQSSSKENVQPQVILDNETHWKDRRLMTSAEKQAMMESYKKAKYELYNDGAPVFMDPQHIADGQWVNDDLPMASAAASSQSSPLPDSPWGDVGYPPFSSAGSSAQPSSAWKGKVARKRVRAPTKPQRMPMFRASLMDRRPQRQDWGGLPELRQNRLWVDKFGLEHRDQWWRDDKGRLSPDCIGNYVLGQKVGQGSYGAVYVGKYADGSVVAIKKLIMPCKRREGVSKSAIRELMILRELQKYPHPNVVQLLGVCLTGPSPEKIRGTMYTIFDFIPCDIPGLIKDRKDQRKDMHLSEVKCIARQILLGMKHIHSFNIIHRDIKAANLLISANGVIKIADFGLARVMDAENPGPYTRRVITLWYVVRRCRCCFCAAFLFFLAAMLACAEFRVNALVNGSGAAGFVLRVFW